MASPFHPDFKHARFLPRTLVPAYAIPLWNAGLAVQAALTRDGHVAARGATGQEIWLYRPEGAKGPRPALLWIHGGGTVCGHPVSEAKIAAELSRTRGLVVALPRYRLAGKAPYPAALDDVFAALEWLAAHPEVDPARIAVGGDSAGGGLAACLAIAARDRGGPPVAYQVLHEPMLDEGTRRRPAPDPKGLRIWSSKANTRAWGLYLRGVEGDVPGTASAARAPDLTGLPPAFLGVGTADLFHDETLAYARRLRESGVECTLDVVPGGFHGFALAPRAPVARAYRARMQGALARGLGLETPPQTGDV